jgi:tripartite-type tricarboxylate transporter receptor subunit TctC
LLAPAVIEVMAGRAAMCFAVPGAGIPYVSSGTLRALGVTGATRAPLLTDVPAVAEGVLPGFETVSYYALLVPAATPRELVAKLSNVVNTALSSPGVRDNTIHADSEPAVKSQTNW